MPRLPKDPESRAHVLVDQALTGFTTAQKQLEEANSALRQVHDSSLTEAAYLRNQAELEAAHAEVALSTVARNERIIQRLADLTA